MHVCITFSSLYYHLLTHHTPFSNPLSKIPTPKNMRPTPPSTKNQTDIYPTVASSTTTTPTCSPNTCKWRPYSNSNDFETNAILILVILFCALICALALNAAIRCFLRGEENIRGRRRRRSAEERKPGVEESGVEVVVAPTVSYSSEMKLVGAVAECAICLSEFVEGDAVQVLGRCKHGFHEQCIQLWLSSSHHSCPTCRCSCLSSPPPTAP